MLKPNEKYVVNDVEVLEKIIPDGTRWQNASKAQKAGFTANALYKREEKLTKNTGKPKFVTIHNTDDLDNVEDDGEQYTRATYNENMGSVRIHFYVDDLCAWQNMKAGTGMCKNDPEGSAEVSWHAGDGSATDGGNMTSLSMEIIMNDTAEHDAKAKNNGARLAAWLLWKHGLTVDRLVTHTYWVNQSAGKSFKDVDEQCTNLVQGKKWCPAYIFGSTAHQTALANWKAFKKLVGTYLDELNQTIMKPSEILTEDMPKEKTTVKVQKGDLVSLASNATYYNGKSIPAWVKNQSWYVKEIAGDRAVIDKNEEGTNAINSPIHVKYLTVIGTASKTEFKPYLVRITANDLSIRKGAGTNYALAGSIRDKGTYTIVAENDGPGASKWGKLKSGAGWISLDYTNKL